MGRHGWIWFKCSLSDLFFCLKLKLKTMKKQLGLAIFCTLILFFSVQMTLGAQIHDIKKNSSQNKANKSNNSSGDNSSESGDIGSEIASGCISSLFDMFVGCLFSGRNDADEDNFIVDQPDYYNDNLLIEIEKNKIKDNQDVVSDSSEISDNQKINPNKGNIIEYDDFANKDHEKLPGDYSLDLKVNFALGFEYSKEKTYTYYNFLPGVRANLSWFLIDFRYNILTEFSESLPDAFKTWDLLFMLKLNAGDQTKIMLGSGMHKEEYSSTLYNQHFLGVKTGFSGSPDFINIDGRLTMDYSTEEFPFSEIGITFNKRFLDTQKVFGYFSIGALYQNYYQSTDIWALKAGIILNWHK